jgi:rhodanese-related sulfurtransferase
MRWFIGAVLIALPLAPALADHAITPRAAHRDAAAGELTIVDVRLPMEWAKTGLPENARGVSLQDPETFKVRAGFVADLLAAVGADKTAEIALICASGSRSSFAQQLLKTEGFTNVHDISEGMLGGPTGPGWLARELPTEPCDAC